MWKCGSLCGTGEPQVSEQARAEKTQINVGRGRENNARACGAACACSEDKGDVEESSELQTSEAGIDLKGIVLLSNKGRTYS